MPSKAVAAGVRVMTTTQVSFGVLFYNRTVVGTGANEVIRLYTHQWWMDIKCGTRQGKKVSMELAGNVAVAGVMAKYGEGMMKDGVATNSGVEWILPVSRMQEELGVEARWRGNGTAALIIANGCQIELVKEQGLAFISWEDFVRIRKMLADSHAKGRRTKWVQDSTDECVSCVLQRVCGGRNAD